MNNKRGQISSIDALVSNVIFAIILVAMLVFWFVSMESISNTIAKNRMETVAISLSDLLVKSEGEPGGWEYNITSLKRPGFAVSDENQNVLSSRKIAEFTELPYNTSKHLLGLDETYGYHLIVEELNNNRIYQAGDPDIDEESTVISVLRYAVLKEGQRPQKTVRLRLIIYEAE